MLVYDSGLEVLQTLLSCDPPKASTLFSKGRKETMGSNNTNLNLLISLEGDVLLGCYDMLSVYGGDPSSENMEVIVSEVLKSLIRGLRDDNFIPSYESHLEILEKLQAIFPNQALSLSFESSEKSPTMMLPEAVEEAAKNVQRAIEERGSFSEVRQDVEKDVASLPSETEGSGSGEDSEKEEPTLVFSQLPGLTRDNDPLVKEATGDSLKEDALVEIYSMIPQDLWGASRARKMWEALLSHKEKQEEEKEGNPQS